MINIFKNILLNEQIVGIQINNQSLYCSFIKPNKHELNDQSIKNNKAKTDIKNNINIELLLEHFEFNNFEIHDLSIYNYFAVSQSINQFLNKYNIKRPVFLFSLEGAGVIESIEEVICNNLLCVSNNQEQLLYVGNRKIKYAVHIDQEKLIQFNLLAQMFNYNLFAITTPLLALYYSYKNLCKDTNTHCDINNILESNSFLDESLEPLEKLPINIDSLKQFLIDKMAHLKITTNQINNNPINLDKLNSFYKNDYNVLSAIGLYYFWKASQ